MLIATLIRPPLRDRINERFNRGAMSQQFLVESVVGIHTLKAAAVEPMLRTQWEEKLAAYVKTSFQAVMLSASIGQNAIQYASKATTRDRALFGAIAVIMATDGRRACRFQHDHGTGHPPILRLSQLRQDFQQVQISVERLGDILNCPPESRAARRFRRRRRAVRSGSANGRFPLRRRRHRKCCKATSRSRSPRARRSASSDRRHPASRR